MCKHKVSAAEIKETIFAQKIPYCPQCATHKEGEIVVSAVTDPSTGSVKPACTADSDVAPVVLTDRLGAGDAAVDESSTDGGGGVGILKPDIVFFGEDLSPEFHDTLASDMKRVDMLLVIGSSLKVRPVAHIPSELLQVVVECSWISVGRLVE